MAKKLTVHDRLVVHLMTADRTEIERLRDLCSTALTFRFSVAPVAKRPRKPKLDKMAPVGPEAA